MAYKPTSQLDPSRLPDVVESLQAEDIIVERFEDGRVNKLKGKPCSRFLGFNRNKVYNAA
jgi:hypothetical protein